MNDEHVGEAESESSDAERLALEVRKLAHDLNNALMPLMMGLSVVRKKVDDPALDRTLTNMEKSVRRAGDLSNQILALAHHHSSRVGGEQTE